jgi:hypothetical protein
MRKFLVRAYIPVYYDIEAEDEAQAEQKAIGRFKAEQKTRREPTVEVLMDDGFLTGFWDVVDARVDEYKDRGL